MRILLTGGAGFLGSNLIRFLTDRTSGGAVSALDLAAPEQARENIGEDAFDSAGFSYWQGSILDRGLVSNLVRNSDVIVHLAAETGVGASIADPLSCFEANINGTLSILEACREYPPGKFVYVSASSVYGLPEAQPVTEEERVLPVEPYGGSKAAAESLVRCCGRTYGIDHVIIRPFNIYGPIQSPSRLVPTFVINALKDARLPIPGDGSASGDWMFVDDFCRAMDRIILSDSDKLSGEIINLATGKGRKLSEIAGTILDMLGKSESMIQFTEDREEYPQMMVASTAKMELLTGWRPSCNLNSGLSKTIDWYNENRAFWGKQDK